MNEIAALKSKKLPELQEIAKTIGLKRITGLKKLELIDKIIDELPVSSSDENISKDICFVKDDNKICLNFKEINDSDYYLVTQLIEEEVEEELFESSLRDKLISKYGENYPNIDFKVKLLIEFNGKADVDILSMQFKNDISDNINKLTMGKSISEINEIISDLFLSSFAI